YSTKTCKAVVWHYFFSSSRRRHTRSKRDWSSDVCSSDLNGMGMDDTALQNVFDPFFTTKEAKKGTGLGLSVSLGIAVAHEGDISVVSNVGQGSAFTLKIPKVKATT